MFFYDRVCSNNTLSLSLFVRRRKKRTLCRPVARGGGGGRGAVGALSRSRATIILWIFSTK